MKCSVYGYAIGILLIVCCLLLRMPGFTPEEVLRILYTLQEDVEDSDVDADSDEDFESPNTLKILQ